MIRIVHILQCMAERSGGPGRIARGLGSAVASREIAVSYRSPAPKEDMTEFASYGSQVRTYGMDWPRAWFRSKALAAQLADEIGSIDILHIHEAWSHPAYAAAKIARASRTPYLITPHGELEPWRVQNGRVKHVKKQIYLSLLGRRMLRGATCLQANTIHEVDGLRQSGYHGPVCIIPNGIDPDRHSELPDPIEAEQRWPGLKGRRVVLFLARLQKEKGLDQLIPAWKDLTDHSSYDDAVLVVAGPDDRGYRDIVDGLIEQYDVGLRVLVTGMVRGREKMALVSRADVYVLPSYSEGFSMAVLENLAAAKPVLITPGCNFPEVAEAAAGLCVPPESGPLEEALRALLDMPDADRKAMGRRGQDLVRKNYTWDIAGRKMITVYRCILEGREIPLHPQPADPAKRAA